MNLNPQQHQAVTHEQGPLLIIAGAGTGKTTVVTQRIKHLILEKNVDPSSILALTFTEKAAHEMEERVDVALPYGYTQLWIATFHAFCDRILRNEGIHIGLNPAFKLTSESESLLFLQKNLFSFKLNYFRPLGNPYKFLQGMLQHFNRLKDDDITPNDYITFAETLTHDANQITDDASREEAKKTRELANAYETYETLKRKEGLMDFSDLNANVLQLFRKRPNILQYYQQKFAFILVDEFQDTNYAQNELAMLLAGNKKNITVVGDDDQSIYRWRGAAISNILQFKKRYPEAKIVTLTKNYRSTEDILISAYTMIQHNNPDRLEVKEQINKKLEAMRRTQSTPVGFLYANSAENESEQVKNTIKKLVKEKGYEYKDFAILVRANDHAQPFTRTLERARIPFQFLGPGHLFQQDEIKDLISYMKVLYNFEDTAALYRILTLPIFAIEARDIAAILNFAKKQQITLFETCEKISELYVKEHTQNAVQKILDLINKHLKLVPRETAGQILYYFLEDSGLLQEYLSAELPMQEKKAQNIAKFFERLKSLEASHTDASIFSVVDWIDLAMQLGESPMSAEVDWAENNAVNILTVHSSKGLEFPVVFLVSLVTQRFPSRDRKEQIPVPEQLIKEQLPEGDANIQEERRLFYVGMTRAKDNLYLTAAQFYGDGKRQRKISPFVTEAIGNDTVQKIIHQKTIEQSVKQLSLLDMANETIQQNAQKEKAQLPVKSFSISTISYSQLQTFSVCPLHYKLKYILKMPQATTASQSYGVSVHAALKEYYQKKMQGDAVIPKNISDILKKYWQKEGYENREHAKLAFSQGVDMLTHFLQEEKHTQPLALEVPFSFFLEDIKITGRIDRIDALPDGKIEIIDYKTGTTIPDEKKLSQNLQLSLYALATSEVKDQLIHHDPEHIVLSLLYLEKNRKVSTMRTSQHIEKVREDILEKIHAIETSDFKCSGSILCQNCEYKMLCQSHG